MAHLDNINWFQLCIFALLIIEKHIKQLYYESKTFSFGFGFVALGGSFGRLRLTRYLFQRKMKNAGGRVRTYLGIIAEL